jgi:hypothetical protein
MARGRTKMVLEVCESWVMVNDQVSAKPSMAVEQIQAVANFRR